MASRRSISEHTQLLVRRRANGLCEYCHANEKWQYVCFTIDHIISLSQGGTNDSENLALACFRCNRQKSNYETSIDPRSGLPSSLFHPRQDVWADHFIWSENGGEVIGLTPVGRATIERLRLNTPRIIDIRLADVAIGRHPPLNDPRESGFNIS